MTSVEVLKKYEWWLDAVRDLLTHAHAVFPRTTVAEMLKQTMDFSMASWNWAEPDGSFGCEFNGPGPPQDWLLTSIDPHTAYNLQRRHPLVQWFDASGDPRPLSVHRVPPYVASSDDFALVAELLGPVELEEQLSIPYRLEGGCHRAFVLARGGEDFSDDDVDLARRVQPLLALLDRQIAITREERAVRAAEAGLTARETTVLLLLSDGGTADAIARRLGVSPRTVHHHLSHIYRKLGVNDRMRAVLVAQSAGLIRARPGSPRTPGDVGTSLAEWEAEGMPTDVATQPLLRTRRLDWAYLAGRQQHGSPKVIQLELEPTTAIDQSPRQESVERAKCRTYELHRN